MARIKEFIRRKPARSLIWFTIFYMTIDLIIFAIFDMLIFRHFVFFGVLLLLLFISFMKYIWVPGAKKFLAEDGYYKSKLEKGEFRMKINVFGFKYTFLYFDMMSNILNSADKIFLLLAEKAFFTFFKDSRGGMIMADVGVYGQFWTYGAGVGFGNSGFTGYVFQNVNAGASAHAFS